MKKNNDASINAKRQWNYYRQELKRCFDELKHKNSFYKQIPNLLTVSRIVGMIPVSILFLTGNMIAGTILLGMLFITDFFDGKLARKYGVVSKFGADLDAVCDKVMAIGLMLPLLFNNPILLVNLLLECGISMVTVLGKLKGISTNSSFCGKVKTWFLSVTLGLGYMAKFIPSVYLIFKVFSLITIPAQVKTTTDYISYITFEEKKIKNRELDDNCNLKYSLTREEKINTLEKEKEFLLSTNIEAKEEIKIKKRNK